MSLLAAAETTRRPSGWRPGCWASATEPTIPIHASNAQNEPSDNDTRRTIDPNLDCATRIEISGLAAVFLEQAQCAHRDGRGHVAYWATISLPTTFMMLSSPPA